MCVGCTHIHLVNDELFYGGGPLWSGYSKGDSCAGDSLPYEEWEQIT